MNSVVEKLAAIEKEVAAVQPKMAPLTERIAALDQKITGFAQQLTGLAAESAAVRQDMELTRNSLARIQTLIGESKVESEQLVAGQEENQQRCETMTAVFGAAFQAVSQFFETAQRMGLTDQAKAVFLASSSAQTMPTPPPVLSKPPIPEPPPALEQPSVPEQPIIPEPPVPEPVVAVPVIEEPPVMESAEMEPDAKEPPVEEPIEDAPIGEEPPAPESALSESDFDSALPDAEESAPAPFSLPGLPDVAAPPEMEPCNLDSEAAAIEDTEPSHDMASHLEVLPLNLSAPALPEQSEPAEDEADDQEIEALLATMMTPVTTGA